MDVKNLCQFIYTGTPNSINNDFNWTANAKASGGTGIGDSYSGRKSRLIVETKCVWYVGHVDNVKGDKS